MSFETLPDLDVELVVVGEGSVLPLRVRMFEQSTLHVPMRTPFRGDMRVALPIGVCPRRVNVGVVYVRRGYGGEVVRPMMDNSITM